MTAMKIIINSMKKTEKKKIPKTTHLIFMGTSYDIKEKVYVALVDNSEALEQSDLTYEDTEETRPYISLKQDRFITDSH